MITHTRRQFIMTDAPTREPRPAKIDDVKRAPSKRMLSYERRLKAAGIDNDEVPEDREELYAQTIRKISMYIDRWHGSCPEPICQRNRGCMAPSGRCAKFEERTMEEINRDWHKVQGKFFRALKAAAAAQGVEIP
jgi:hypothetical protein